MTQGPSCACRSLPAPSSDAAPVPSVSFTRALWCCGPCLSLLSLQDAQLTVLLMLPRHCTCCRDLEHPKICTLCLLSFLTTLIQTYWLVKDHFPSGKLRVNYASISHMGMPNSTLGSWHSRSHVAAGTRGTSCMRNAHPC